MKREKADVLDKKTNDEAVKLDGIDQYSRRQNLEFQGISLTENEDAIELVTKISNLVGVDVKKSDISTAHRFPLKTSRRLQIRLLLLHGSLIGTCATRFMANALLQSI